MGAHSLILIIGKLTLGKYMGAAAADLSIEIGDPPRASSAVECEDMSHRDLREEISVGNACERKPGKHRRRAILLSHTQEVESSL